MRLLRALSIGLVLAAGPVGAQTAANDDAPGRVVSMNLCTDQLALMLAAPGQLVSVSHVAVDPRISAMADAAARLPLNHGGAEEIYLLSPDLVLAGTWSDPAAVSLLRRLGLEVVQIGVAETLAEVPDRLAEMGRALGREAEARAMIARFEADLAALAARPGGPRAAFYYPNGYTLGDGTMAHEVLTHAGFRNIALEVTPSATGRIALELLVVAAPDLIIRDQPYPGASRAEEILDHPALQSLISAGAGHVSGPDWTCGTPRILDALRALLNTRAAMEGAP